VNFNPFIVPFDSLPDTLPIFPLAGAIVMPGGELPLNIFETRYLNMVSDALGSHRMIGMIQPDPNAKGDAGLYQTGCAGRITEYRETNDGRIEMLLTGVCRFDLGQELPTTRGYRLVKPLWSRFSNDYTDHEVMLSSAEDLLMLTLKAYLQYKNLNVDWAMLERLSTSRLLSSMCMALPLSEADKQVLLETSHPAERLNTFIAILDSELSSARTVTRH
jgi:Lon protease-like protein